MTATIEVAVPAIAVTAFKDRLELRVRELTADLALEAEPVVSWLANPPEADPLRIAGRSVRLPLSSPGWPAASGREAAEMAAEQFAAALIRDRWALLEPALGALGVPERSTLRDLAGFGLRVDELAALHAEWPTDDVALAFAAAERHPPGAELLLHRGDLIALDDLTFLGAAAEAVARGCGIPMPMPTIKSDSGLDLRRFRLRIGSVRGAVQSERWSGQDKAETMLRRELTRHSPVLFDVGSLLALLLDPERVPSNLARATLERVDARQIAGAIRILLGDGIGLADPLLLCEALTAPAAVLAFTNPSDRVVALPGVVILAEDPSGIQQTELVQRLRAHLVPAHLKRRVAATETGRETLGAWSLGPRTLSYLRKPEVSQDWTKRFAQRALEAVADADLLVVPADQRYRLRVLLADLLPHLTVVGVHEVPPGILRHRGNIDIGEKE